MKMLKLTPLLFFLAALTPAAYAKFSCEADLTLVGEKPATVDYAPPFEQYLRWSEQANTEKWRESTMAFGLQAASVDVSRVEIRLNRLNSASSTAVTSQLGMGTAQMLVPQHPYNTHENVAFFADPRTHTFNARFLASRSIVITDPGKTPFSIKLGTNHPHRGTVETLKTDVSEDINIGLARSELIRYVDSIYSPPKHFRILHEIMAVADRSDPRKGYLVRELTPLLDGNYYLPAFSIPYVGEEIARRHGSGFAAFWGEHYAKALGRAKAELLIRYGLQYDQANAQNLILQLDRNMMPTGQFVLFDLSDMSLVQSVVRADVRQELMTQDMKYGKRSVIFLNPDWLNSWFQMNVGPVSEEMIRSWGKLHNDAYIKEIERLIGTWPKAKQPAGLIGISVSDFRQDIRELETFLGSPEGQQRLSRAVPPR